MKLYIWHQVKNSWGKGCLMAMAETEQQARDVIANDFMTSVFASKIEGKKPQVKEPPFAMYERVLY